MNYKIKFTPGINNKEPDVLEMEGCLTIHQVNEIWQDLEQKLNKSKAIKLQVRNVEQLDVSFLQLLIAVRNRFHQLQQPFVIDFKLSQEMEDLLIVSGFESFITANSQK